MASGRDFSVAIHVKMFGKFSIDINGNTIANLKGSTKRVWMLIQYLIANRFETIPIKQLIEDLWDGNPCRDPENALKNLVYRARALLKTLSGRDNIQFILFINGTYTWNNRYECEIDSENFLKYYRTGKNNAISQEKRICAYKNAIALYHGGFLPKSAYTGWVISLSSSFSKKYIECIQDVCNILIGLRRLDEVIPICKAGLKESPLEESFYKMLLFAYVGLGRRNDAFEQYTRASELFYKEYGIDISESLSPYYKQLVNNGDNVETDLSAIKKDLREEAGACGAYFCDYDIFKCLYRAQARVISRTGQSVFIVLFTLSSTDGNPPALNTAKAAVEKLKTAIKVTLRKGDAVTSYSASQFIVMLPMISYENAQRVINRIIKKFRFEYRKNDVIATTKISPLE